MPTPMFQTDLPTIFDTRRVLLVKILENLLSALSTLGGTVSNPIYQNSYPQINDSEQTLLIKICEASNGVSNAISGGSSGSYAAGGNFSGTGSPEGSVTANKGATYVQLDEPGRIWAKTTDSTNTGWAF